MFVILIVFLPATVISAGVGLAFWAGNFTDQFPWGSALAAALLSPRVTVTSSPASAQPQMGSVLSACSTMLFPMIAGKRTSARADIVQPAPARIAANPSHQVRRMISSPPRDAIPECDQMLVPV